MKKKLAFSYQTADELRRSHEELKKRYSETTTMNMESHDFFVILKKYLRNDYKVIDLGSANGNIFKLFSKLGITDSYGSDINNYLSKDKPTNDFFTLDLNTEKIPLSNSVFDAVTSIEVIEHLENPFHFIREASRLLKSGGLFILATPNCDHIYNKISFLFKSEFYRFLAGNDHIMPIIDPIFKKGVLRYFELVEVNYLFGEFPYKFFNKFKWPSNKYFGRSVVYVLKKK